MGRLQRVFIDTSELFPFTIMDLLLTLAGDFLFTWVWTDEVLDEWEEVIVRQGLLAAHCRQVRLRARGATQLSIRRYTDRTARPLWGRVSFGLSPVRVQRQASAWGAGDDGQKPVPER